MGYGQLHNLLGENLCTYTCVTVCVVCVPVCDCFYDIIFSEILHYHYYLIKCIM